nr:MAG TPA: hypothetical protein [Caudoviricetes sp.]
MIKIKLDIHILHQNIVTYRISWINKTVIQ